jgi:protein-S-isoprenylcysteine O-methyltransferase Ste14
LPSAASLIVVRTVLEDRLLHRDLAGYPDYAGKVRFRLVPGVW